MQFFTACNGVWEGNVFRSVCLSTGGGGVGETPSGGRPSPGAVGTHVTGIHSIHQDDVKSAVRFTNNTPNFVQYLLK